MYEEERDYLVSTKYLYYIIGKGSYSDEIDIIIKNFIKDMQAYREYADGEFYYYILKGKDLNTLSKYYETDNIEIVNDGKKLIREVI